MIQRPRHSNQLEPAVLMAIQHLCSVHEEDDEESDINEESDESEESNESEEEEEEGNQSSEDGEGVAYLDERLSLIEYALTLDVEGTMEQRQNRTGEGCIKIKKRLQPDENTHTFMMLTALSMGYDLPTNSWAEKQ